MAGHPCANSPKGALLCLYDLAPGSSAGHGASAGEELLFRIGIAEPDPSHGRPKSMVARFRMTCLFTCHPEPGCHAVRHVVLSRPAVFSWQDVRRNLVFPKFFAVQDLTCTGVAFWQGGRLEPAQVPGSYRRSIEPYRLVHPEGAHTLPVSSQERARMA